MHDLTSMLRDQVIVATSPQSTMRPLAGCTALVTGSTRGIGTGIASALGEAGCNLVLNGRTPSAPGERLASQMGDLWGVDAVYHPADLRRPEEVLELVLAAQDRLGHIDILVNNAGIQHVAPVETFDDEAWDAVLSLNLSAAFRATKAVLPGMRERGFGRIINIASVHGLVASVHKSAYVAAKHGLLGFTKVVALETANDGITCNAICPGWVLTDLVERQIGVRAEADGRTLAEASADLLRAKQPMQQFSSVESVGALTLFLCGPHGRTITGAAYTMDGGWTAV
jgi:3-hydroxybutyrate dehydrogenase